jgi:hypothetical protein
MARKRGRKAKAQRLPVQRFLYYQFLLDPTKPKFLDLACALSAINGRLYRQGRMYHVANVTMHNTDGKITSLKLSTIPDTYTAKAGWHAMFDAWKDQRARVLENSVGPITGKWADFKVLMNDDMASDDWELPTDCDNHEIRGGTQTGGTSQSEWAYSTVNYTDKDGTDHQGDVVGMLGSTNTTNEYVSVLEELYRARAYTMIENPEVDPDVIKESVIFGMNPANQHSGSNADLLASIAEDNDIPPYNNEFPVGFKNPDGFGKLPFPVREMGITSTSVLTQTVGGFPVPLGLVHVEGTTSDSAANNIGLIFELVPGRYKGIHSEAF